MRRHQLAQMLVIGAIASAVGVAIALAIDWFPAQASEQADDIDDLYDVLLIASVPIFVLVEVVVLFSIWKFRMRPGQEEEDGPPIHGNTRLEVIWTTIPAILLVGLCTWAYVVLTDIEDAKANEQQIVVTGEQFTWTFEYPASVAGGEKLVSNQLYLVKDRPYRFTVRSKDVIHDFWVPEFRMKIDAVPGIDTRVRVTPNKAGDYGVVCAELCGLGHAAMRQTVHVVSQQEFDAWVAERRSAAGGGGGGTQGGGGGGTQGGGGDAAGKALFTDNGCQACHALADAGSTAEIGPNLDEALEGQSADQVRRSIVEPNAEIAKGFGANIMPPNFGDTLSDEELDALVAYLLEVTK